MKWCRFQGDRPGGSEDMAPQNSGFFDVLIKNLSLVSNITVMRTVATVKFLLNMAITIVVIF